MKITPCKCPECGGDIRGTVDQVPGIALLTDLGGGDFEYAGETEVFWDGQTPETDADGRQLVQCENSHEFYATVEE